MGISVRFDAVPLLCSSIVTYRSLDSRLRRFHCLPLLGINVGSNSVWNCGIAKGKRVGGIWERKRNSSNFNNDSDAHTRNGGNGGV